MEKNKTNNKSKEEDILIGPMPPETMELKISDARSKLLPGEGEAMARYLVEGKRIPRRGEIGLDSDQIKNLEDAGWVLSGSRHKTMERVRLRKTGVLENAKDRLTLAMFNKEERSKREIKILNQFKDMIKRKKTDKE